MSTFQKLLIKNLPAKTVYKQLASQMKDHESFMEFFKKQDPSLFETIQEKFLFHTLHDSAKRVPQFSKFIASKRINLNNYKTVSDFVERFPETTKKNYIYKAKKFSDLCRDGKLEDVSLVVKSSGHSGKQTYWLKSHGQDMFLHSSMGMGLDMNYGIYSKRTLVLNGFILGSWVAGINFGDYASWHCPVINIGPDKEEILQTLGDLYDQFDQFIISGYPPFLKDLVDFLSSDSKIAKSGKIHLFPGAEGFPESWRKYVQSKLKNSRVISGFGASDIGLVCGMESDDTIFIRQLSEKNMELHKKLFGDLQETPMLFQYTLNNHICTNKNNELIFTTILPETTEPVIKYNLKDQGGVISYTQMTQIFSELGIEYNLKVPLPFFYYSGRSSGAANYNGFFIYPENIKDCIYQNKKIAEAVTGKFHFHVKYMKDHSKKLFIGFQLKQSQRVSSRLTKTFKDAIISTLSDVNGGYRATLQRFGKLAEPEIVLYSYKDFPSDNSIKNHYS